MERIKRPSDKWARRGLSHENCTLVLAPNGKLLYYYPMDFLKTMTHKALLRSERFFKTDMVYLARSGFWLSVGQTVALFSTLLLAIAFSRILPKETYGLYKFVLSAASIIGSLSLSGMGTVLVQAVAQGAEGTLKSSVQTHLRWGSVVLIAGIIGGGYYLLNDNHLLAAAFLIAGLCLPLIGALGLYSAFLSGKKDFRQSTLNWITTQCAQVALLIAVGYFYPQPLALVAVYFISQALAAIYFYVHTVRKYKPNTITDANIITYGKHISAMNFIGAIANQLDKILVFHFVGAAPLATYSFAFAIPEQIKGLFKNVFNVAIPKYAELPPARLKKSIIRKTWQLTGIALVLFIAYDLVAPFLFRFLFPQYLDAVWYSQLYMFGILFVPGIALFSIYFQLRKATATLYKLSIINNIATLLLTTILISNFGVLGAVMENTISWFFMFLVNGYFFLKDPLPLDDAPILAVSADTFSHENN